MDEMYEMVRKLNRIESTVDELSARLRFVLKYPAVLHSGDDVSEKEACSILHISRSKIRILRKSGEIPVRIHQRKLLYPVEGLQKYLESHTLNK